MGDQEEEGCGEEARSSKMDSHVTYVTQFIYPKCKMWTIVCSMFIKLGSVCDRRALLNILAVINGWTVCEKV